MANRKVTMTDLRVIIREFAKGTPLREIERKLGLSRTSIRTYRERAEQSGRTMLELQSLEDAELHVILSRNDAHRGRDEERYKYIQDNIEEYAQQMRRRYMTYDVLYEEYCKSTSNPYGYTQFKAIIQEYIKNHDYKYHNVYSPAQEMQFDFAGKTMWVVDTGTGECRQVYILVVLLPYSMMSFAIGMLSTKMEYMFDALSKALSYFGGVPEVVKTDNMSQWVKKYDRYEPSLTEACQQWCLHYKTDLDSCRSGKPRDKGAVESLVNQVYRYYYSRAYHETFTSIGELNARLMELNDQYNNEVMKGRTYSRRERFESEEQPYLLPLPSEPYRFKYEKSIKINSTYHFQIDRNHFYSVPFQYVGQKAKVVYDAYSVEVWINMKRIATHVRSYNEGYTTVPEHMPEKHRAFAQTKEYNAAYFLKKARQIGPQTTSVVESILTSAIFVQQSYRACQGIIRLTNRYGNDRVESACKILEPKSAATYKRVKTILENNMDLLPSDNSQALQSYIPHNDNVRGAGAYQ